MRSPGPGFPIFLDTQKLLGLGELGTEMGLRTDEPAAIAVIVWDNLWKT